MRVKRTAANKTVDTAFSILHTYLRGCWSEILGACIVSLPSCHLYRLNPVYYCASNYVLYAQRESLCPECDTTLLQVPTKLDK